MTDGPYDYARERWDAMNASRIATRIIGGVEYDEDDLPSKSDLAYDAELDKERP